MPRHKINKKVSRCNKTGVSGVNKEEFFDKDRGYDRLCYRASWKINGVSIRKSFYVNTRNETSDIELKAFRCAMILRQIYNYYYHEDDLDNFSIYDYRLNEWKILSIEEIFN